MKKIKVNTEDGVFLYETIEDAQTKFPEIDLNRNTERFRKGIEEPMYIRFDDWGVLTPEKILKGG